MFFHIFCWYLNRFKSIIFDSIDRVQCQVVYMQRKITQKDKQFKWKPFFISQLTPISCLIRFGPSNRYQFHFWLRTIWIDMNCLINLIILINSILEILIVIRLISVNKQSNFLFKYNWNWGAHTFLLAFLHKTCVYFDSKFRKIHKNRSWYAMEKYE